MGHPEGRTHGCLPRAVSVVLGLDRKSAIDGRTRAAGKLLGSHQEATPKGGGKDVWATPKHIRAMGVCHVRHQSCTCNKVRSNYAEAARKLHKKTRDRTYGPPLREYARVFATCGISCAFVLKYGR